MTDLPSSVAGQMVNFISKESDPQTASPLFNRIPAEIRNYIFELALTSFDDKTRPYKKGAYYYRPDYRHAQKIDTNLLLTCRRISFEAEGVPASINEHTSWYERAPADVTKNELSMAIHPAALKRRLRLKTLHLFTQQFWLEGVIQRRLWPQTFERLTQSWDHVFANVTCLKITLRHSDWWFWEHQAPIALEPKRRGRASACNHHAKSSDPFEVHSWGAQFRNIKGLKKFQLELETIDKKKAELDALVERAPGWRFPLGDGQLLVLDQAKTRRAGWVGQIFDRVEHEREFDTYIYTPIMQNVNRGEIEDIDQEGSTHVDGLAGTHPQPAEADNAKSISSGSKSEAPAKLPNAKERLVAQGVRFVDENLEPRLPENQLQTYYVVTLTWYAHRDLAGPGEPFDISG